MLASSAGLAHALEDESQNLDQFIRRCVEFEHQSRQGLLHGNLAGAVQCVALLWGWRLGLLAQWDADLVSDI